MAFVLTPRFAPIYQPQQSNPFCCYESVARPCHSYRISRPQARRPQLSGFDHFVNQIGTLLLSDVGAEAARQAQLEAHMEAQRVVHRQRQHCERALRANFAVNQTDQGWQVDGDLQGFEQENINIEVINEHTLKISGNTQSQSNETTAEKFASAAVEASPKRGSEAAVGPKNSSENSFPAAGSPGEDSDAESHKSYQATVEDDYEDLAAEFASHTSASSGTTIPAELIESQGKQKRVDEPTMQPSAEEARTAKTSAQQFDEKSQEKERVHGAFEKVLRFPERINVANVRASFEENVLKITIPKAQAPQIKKIQIL